MGVDLSSVLELRLNLLGELFTQFHSNNAYVRGEDMNTRDMMGSVMSLYILENLQKCIHSASI